jgi:malonyl CoA-acyl carrier protein transacylase
VKPAILLLLTAGLLVAAEPPAPITFTTSRGEKFENVRVISQTPLEISIQTESGIARVPFADLSPELRAQFGYDHAKAVAYRNALIEEEARRKHAEKVEWTRQQQARLEEQRQVNEISRALENGWKPIYDPLTRRTYNSEAEASAGRANAVDFMRGRRPTP